MIVVDPQAITRGTMREALRSQLLEVAGLGCSFQKCSLLRIPDVNVLTAVWGLYEEAQLAVHNFLIHTRDMIRSL